MSENERFAAPEYDCDLIMKGGITSGIVYPPALAEIAKDHRLHGVGGTSAGAIAAAAAAAAELGRNSERGGFARLEQLPDELKEVDGDGRTKLFRLFQAQRPTRSTFELIWNYRKRSGIGRVVGGLVDVARMAAGLTPIWTPLIVLVTVVAAALVAIFAGPLSLVVGIPLVIVGVIAAGLVRFVSVVPDRLAANSFGLCNGMTPADSDDPALTDWLHEQLQRLAGRRDDGVDEGLRNRPVTFGDLAERDIELVMLTTNVSRGTSETVPFRERIWAYDPDELGALFPPDVMAHLAAHASPPPEPELVDELERLGLVPLPDAAELPIVIGMRMSLAFPVLLSAIPLHGVTVRRAPDGGWSRTYVRNWFSDGGITSNLPVRLFDSVLPSRPTYGINLSGGADPTATNPAVNVWRPIGIRQGGLPPTNEIAGIAGLLGGVFDTMQNWADNDNSRVVGFKDRICTIRLGEGEGGMNLDMPPEKIDGLTARGACAGDNLASIRRGVRTCRADEPDAEEAEIEANQWDRHRWIRFRMALGGVSGMLRSIGARWAPAGGSDTYRELCASVAPDDPAWQSYRDDWSGVRSAAVRALFDAPPDVLVDDWPTAGQPAGFSVAFGPDRAAGTVDPAPAPPPA